MGTHRDPQPTGAASEHDQAFHRAHGYWPRPLLVQWMVTHRCSLRCPHCLDDAPAGEPELALDEVDGLLDEIARLGVPQLLLTGGEPAERPDLPAIIDRLGERQIRYSLNTATLPSAACQAAMRRWPPSFVAVSLDGPRVLHDAFRGRAGAFDASLAAIELYAELTGGRVAAGTTVTAENLHALSATFDEVIRSGASSWGLHLVVPEGRARSRPDLRLSTEQARDLLRFAAACRTCFPVNLADEIGYLGEWEPFVRDRPFYCGAGRAQCVVLPDGLLVPCTTVDRATAAGSIRERPLVELWRDGFGALRRAELPTRCSRCDYLPACRGGCWLERRHGTACLLPVWQRSGTLASTASVAVCLGLACCSGSGASTAVAPARPGGAEPTSATATTVATTAPRKADAAASSTAHEPATPTDALLLRCLAAAIDDLDRYPARRDELEERLKDDPARSTVLAYLDDEPAADLATRVARVRAALGSRQPSLYLASLLWRDLATWSLDCRPPTERSATERRLLRETLGELDRTVRAWRLRIVAGRLDPFLTRQDASEPYVVLTKALDTRTMIGPESAIAFKHWGSLPSPATRAELTRAFLARHPFALGWRLGLEAPADRGLERLTSSGAVPVAGTTDLDVFDLVKVPAGAGTVGATLTYGTRRLALQGEGRNAEVVVAAESGQRLPVALPRGTELTHVDLLRLAYEQHHAELVSALAPPFQVLVLRERLARELATLPPDHANVTRTRWQLLRAWLF